jgi:hypothetical protein
MTTLCLKHSDPRDTSIMRPKDAPCSCEPDIDEVTQDAFTNGEYTFLEHLRVFYPAEYKRRVREVK